MKKNQQRNNVKSNRNSQRSRDNEMPKLMGAHIIAIPDMEGEETIEISLEEYRALIIAFSKLDSVMNILKYDRYSCSDTLRMLLDVPDPSEEKHPNCTCCAAPKPTTVTLDEMTSSIDEDEPAKEDA